MGKEKNLLDCENMSDGYLYKSEVLFYVGVSFEHNASHSNYWIQNTRDISIYIRNVECHLIQNIFWNFLLLFLDKTNIKYVDM